MTEHFDLFCLTRPPAPRKACVVVVVLLLLLLFLLPLLLPLLLLEAVIVVAFNSCSSMYRTVQRVRKPNKATKLRRSKNEARRQESKQEFD